jgi:TrmH family RNA methyltransferase
VVEAARLHRARERRLHNLTLIEGPNLLGEAVAAGVLPQSVFAQAGDSAAAAVADRHGLSLLTVDEGAMGRLAGTKTPRGPVAVIEIPAAGSTAAPGILVAWGVSDPGNVGTLIRTAAAFGWDFGHTPGTADPWAPKVLRAGAGGHFRAGIRPIGSISDLEDAGYVPVATVVAGGTPPDEIPGGRYGVLVGEESSGLPHEVVSRARLRVSIEMPGGVESLNAAIAAGIIVYELSKPGREDGGRV